MLHTSAILICEFAGTAFTMYYLAGFFGAAAYGQDTEGNILENSLGSNTKAQGALNIFMTGKVFLRIYICFRSLPRHVRACNQHTNAMEKGLKVHVGERSSQKHWPFKFLRERSIFQLAFQKENASDRGNSNEPGVRALVVQG